LNQTHDCIKRIKWRYVLTTEFRTSWSLWLLCIIPPTEDIRARASVHKWVQCV